MEPSSFRIPRKPVASNIDVTQIELVTLPGSKASPRIENVHNIETVPSSSIQPLLQDGLFTSRNALQEQRMEDVKAWTPVMLRRWVLILFIILFLLLVIGLEVVLKTSKDKNGFGPTGSNLHYVWTYGPTAVLTLIVAFWTQVDYRSRQMQPWRELKREPQPASNGLLLDYISPNVIMAFFLSLKKRHWPVSAAMLGSLLLTALIVISTGLFTLRALPVPQLLPFSMNEQFQFNNFDPGAVDDVAAAFYAGVSFEGLEYPPGTNASYAVETFNTSRVISAKTHKLTANAKTFTTNLDCEPAELLDGVRTICPWYSGCTSISATVAVRSTNCSIPSIPDDDTPFYVSGNGIGGWYGKVFSGSCQESNQGLNQQRLVIFCFKMEPGDVIPNGTNPFTNNTALICNPSFAVQQSTVTIDKSGSLQNIENSTKFQVPGNITSANISNAVKTTINQLGYGRIAPRLTDNHTYEANYTVGQSLDSFFRLILSSQGSTDIADVVNPQILAKGAQEVFRGVAAQVGRRYLLTANSTEASPDYYGTAEYDQQRLFVRSLSVRLMESILCILCVISIYLLFKATRDVTPQDPASIARLTSLISQSKSLIATLSPTGSWSGRNLTQLLQGTCTTQFVPTTYEDHGQPQLFTFEYSGDFGQYPMDIKEWYWKPVITSWLTRVSLCVLPISTAIALEIILQKSQRENGLLKVNPSRTTQLASSFVPASIMVLIDLLFDAFNFNLLILDPYVQLRDGFAQASRNLFDRSIYTWKTHAFWDTIVRKRAAVGASSLAALLASFLAIAASGLYTVEEIPYQTTINVSRLDIFTNPVPMYESSNGAMLNTPVSYELALAARLVANENMPSPLWTSGPYVVPRLHPSPDNSHIVQTFSNITLNTLVQTGTLTCTLVPADQITANYSSKSNSSEVTIARVHWPFLDAPNCTNIIWNSQADYVLTAMVDGPFAEWNSFQFLDSGTKCPAAWAVYGAWHGAQGTVLNAVMCWSSIQEKQALVQFSLPSWKVTSLASDDTTTKNIATTQDTLLNLGSSVFSDVAHAGSIDNVFRTFLRGQKMDELNLDLLEHENFDKLYRRIREVYGLAYAQVLSGQGRKNTTTADDIPSINGTAYVASSYRLKQSAIATRILEGLLIAMAICSIVNMFILNLSRVVPKNPSSIAAQASLVAGSAMMARLPARSQWMEDKEFEALFASSRYSMGWSGGINGQKRFGIDIADVVWPENRKRGSSALRPWVGRTYERLT